MIEQEYLNYVLCNKWQLRYLEVLNESQNVFLEVIETGDKATLLLFVEREIERNTLIISDKGKLYMKIR